MSPSPAFSAGRVCQGKPSCFPSSMSLSRAVFRLRAQTSLQVMLDLIGLGFVAAGLQIQDLYNAIACKDVVIPADTLVEPQMLEQDAKVTEADIGVGCPPQNLVKSLRNFTHKVPAAPGCPGLRTTQLTCRGGSAMLSLENAVDSPCQTQPLARPGY
jgi:hypothetical protein